ERAGSLTPPPESTRPALDRQRLFGMATTQPTANPDGQTGGELRKLGKHTLIYAAGTAIGRLASFLMLPIYTRFLTPADYGVLELLAMTIDLIGMLTGMTIAASVFRFRAAYDDPAEQDEVVSTAYFGTTGLALIAGVLGVLASGALSVALLGEAG